MRKGNNRYIHNTTSAASVTSQHARGMVNKQHRKISFKVCPEEDITSVLSKARSTTLALKILHPKNGTEIQHLQPPDEEDSDLHIWVNWRESDHAISP